MNYVRLPLSFVLYLIYRVVRAYESKKLLMAYGPEAKEYYREHTAGDFAGFVNGR